MRSNLGPWSRQYLGREVSPEEFIRSPEIQDKLFDARFGDYVNRDGERGAASMWFTGEPGEPERSDVHGRLTGRTYADRFMEGLGLPMDGASVSQERTQVPQVTRPTPEQVAY